MEIGQHQVASEKWGKRMVKMHLMRDEMIASQTMLTNTISCSLWEYLQRWWAEWKPVQTRPEPSESCSALVWSACCSRGTSLAPASPRPVTPLLKHCWILLNNSESETVSGVEMLTSKEHVSDDSIRAGDGVDTTTFQSLMLESSTTPLMQHFNNF